MNTSVSFTPLGIRDGHQTAGTPELLMVARLVINNGQHWRAAVEAAIFERPEMRDYHIPIIFFVERGLQRSQQILTDLNRQAIPLSESRSTLSDQHDHSSELSRYVALPVDGFEGTTETERSSLSNRSTKLFTLNAINAASRPLLRKLRNEYTPEDERALATDFWSTVGEAAPDWRLANKRNVASGEQRRDYVHAHGLALSANSTTRAYLVAAHPSRWQSRLFRLAAVDWLRANRGLYERDAMENGKISKSKADIQFTANLLKHHMGLELSAAEQRLEQTLTARHG